MSDETKYLYGASVQGIQEFIFRSSNFKHIVGASLLVDDITKMLCDKYEVQDAALIVNAAGNVKCILNEKKCKEIVLNFPRDAEMTAPGITVSQAVVEMTGVYKDFEKAVEELERRLAAQRNKPMNHTSPRLMAIERDSVTDLPAVFLHIEDGPVDLASKKKFDRFPKLGNQELEEGDYAILHADGNSMGELFAQVGKNQDQLKNFSRGLDELVETCLTVAISLTIEQYEATEADFQKIICSGDDLTLILSSDLALPFARLYLAELEKRSKDLMKDTELNDKREKLTACVGIAYCGADKTFREAYRVANFLCERAKDNAYRHSQSTKGVSPSCVLFFKMSNRFVGNLERAYLRAQQPRGAGGRPCSFEFGPYYLEQPPTGYWTIDKLLKETTAVKNKVDKLAYSWVKSMFTDENQAEYLRQRMLKLAKNPEAFKTLTTPVQRDGASVNVYPASDIISLSTLKRKEDGKNTI